MKILSVDPSISTIGVARISNRCLEEAYTFRTSTADSIVKRLAAISAHFRDVMDDYQAVLIEEPGAFMRIGSYAIKNVASVQMLEMAIGAIVGALADRYPVHLVKVHEWKTYKGKTITKVIAERECGKRLNEHEADAFIMGLNWSRTQMMGQYHR